MQLPFAPKPIATELVSSWLLRVAAANFVSLCELLRGLQSRYDRIPPYWPIDYCLSDVAMTSLSKFCRVPSQEIRRLDLGCRAPHLHPGLLLHFPNGSSIDPRCASQRVRYSFCPLCIQTQPIFVRWDWSLAYSIRCGIHGTALRDGCRSCRAALKSRTGAHVFSTLSSNLIQLSLPLNRGLVYLNRGQTDRRTLSSI